VHGGDRRSEAFKCDTPKRDIKLDQPHQPPTGTSAAAAHRRLREQRPDLHARVLAGEATAHAAMIEAGFRKKRARRKQTPLDKLRADWKAASAEDREAFLTEHRLVRMT
jgi:hypothetical protein